MKRVALLLTVLLVSGARAGVVYDQPHDGSGTILQSSWLDPEGYDGDWYTYDSFVLSADTDISEVRWRGGYKYGAMFGKAFDFSVHFFVSTAGDSQPLCGNPHVEDNIYLARYFVGGNAGETPVGTFGGVQMYDYGYTLPAPLRLSGGVKYWIRVLASHPSVPDWGYARGTGGNGSHFYFNAGGARFGFGSWDACWTLIGSQTQNVAPNSVTLNLGKNTSGTFSTMAVADSVDYVACKFVVPSQTAPIVSMTLDSSTGMSDVVTYRFVSRAHMLQSGQFQIALEPFNFVNGAFDPPAPVSLGTPYSNLTSAGLPASDYVGSLGELRARIRVWRVGPSSSAAPCVGIDQAGWTLTD